MGSTGNGLSIFPETLRSELHGVRKVIEAHSKTGVLVGAKEGTANGLVYNGKNPITVRIHEVGGPAVFCIDRME